MKKLVSVLFALLLIGSTAFAEVAVGAWGRFIFVPASSIDGEDNAATTGPSWADGSRVGVSFSGTSDNVGFNVNLNSNGNAWVVGDQAKIWVKFNDMLKVQGGRVQGDVLRGKIDDSNVLNGLGMLGIAGATGKNDVFKRFETNLGFLVDVTPAEGVYLGAALDAAAQDYNADDEADGLLTEDMLNNIQIGAGYTIANVGLIRAQYIGSDGLVKGVPDSDEPKWFQAAFAYTAMEGVLVDAGIKYNIGDDKVKDSQSLATVTATYGKDALSALVRFQAGFGEDNVSDKLSIKSSLDVSYKVADPLSIGSEAVFNKRDDTMTFVLFPYGRMGYGNGQFKAGFVYQSADDGVDTIATWALPIMMEYSF